MYKNVYFVRHGYALHNKLFWDIGNNAYKIRDTQLLDKGVQQAIELGQTWDYINNIELVVCSPLTRTLDTASLIFKDTPHKIIALDCLLEHPLGTEENCNHRKNKSTLMALYPHVDFSLLKDEHYEWSEDKETPDQLQKRADIFIEWCKKRTEKEICAVSHSSYMGNLIFGTIGDENHQLEHCTPYRYKIDI